MSGTARRFITIFAILRDNSYLSCRKWFYGRGGESFIRRRGFDRRSIFEFADPMKLIIVEPGTSPRRKSVEKFFGGGKWPALNHYRETSRCDSSRVALKHQNRLRFFRWEEGYAISVCERHVFDKKKKKIIKSWRTFDRAHVPQSSNRPIFIAYIAHERVILRFTLPQSSYSVGHPQLS